MMYNNGSQFNQQPQFGGQGQGQYGYEKPKTNLTQYLTNEEISKLRHNEATPIFNPKLSNAEFMGAICTHKDPQKQTYSLTDNHDGTVTCNICKKTFHLFDPTTTSKEEVKQIIQNFRDLIDSIKTFADFIPQDSGRNIFAIDGYISRMEAIWEATVHNYNASTGNMTGMQQNTNYLNTQNMMMGLFGNGLFGAPQPYMNPMMGYQQPAMNPMYSQYPQQPQQQQQYQQYQQPNAQFQQPQNQQQWAAPMNNPMGYQDNMSMMQQQQMMQQPQQPQQQVAPTMPNPQQQMQQTRQTVESPDVKASFKG